MKRVTRTMVAKLMSLPIWVRITASVFVAVAVSLGGISIWSARQQQALAIEQASQFASGSTHLMMVGLAATMASGDAGELKAFLDQFRESRSIKSLKVLRGQAVVQQFGPTPAGAGQADPVEQRVLDKGRPHSAVEEEAGQLVYRAVVPMPAGKNVMGRDCMKCHDSREGSVLGVVSLRIGLDHIRQASRDFQRNTLLVAAIFSALLLAAFYLLITRTISRPLTEVTAQIRDISEGDGDLTKRLRVGSQDEVGTLGTCFNVFVDKLHAVMVDVRRAADHASDVAGQLSAASEQLASGAQEQASSLEETAASLEEITGTVKQNADNAKQANQLAVGSRDVAEKGAQVVAEAVRSMTEINKSSKKIADIITTIDEIAFQTNLLALNAAVEAARAGEQGRGFAVVASEVRNLAQRSATAAKEIKGLIQDSVGKVEAGSALVNKSGETLQEIVASVKRVTGIIAEISAASQEQTSGIDQVNRAVTQMDQVTQANAAQTEELSSTAQSLAAEAGQLQDLVGRFKLDGDHGGPAVRRPVEGAAPAPKPVVAARSVARDRQRRKTDTPVRAAVPAGNGQQMDDGFEDF